MIDGGRLESEKSSSDSKWPLSSVLLVLDAMREDKIVALMQSVSIFEGYAELLVFAWAVNVFSEIASLDFIAELTVVVVDAQLKTHIQCRHEIHHKVALRAREEA